MDEPLRDVAVDDEHDVQDHVVVGDAGFHVLDAFGGFLNVLVHQAGLHHLIGKRVVCGQGRKLVAPQFAGFVEIARVEP